MKTNEEAPKLAPLPPLSDSMFRGMSPPSASPTAGGSAKKCLWTGYLMWAAAVIQYYFGTDAASIAVYQTLFISGCIFLAAAWRPR
jgi:hypothetical protein